jgi:tight adherence protein B
MNHAIPWLCLALALLCLPAPSLTAVRATRLAASGRLVAPRPPRRARLPWPRPARLAVPASALATVGTGWGCGVAIGVATFVAVTTGYLVVASALTRRRDAVRRRQLLAAIRLLVAELDAGSRPADALSAAAELSHRELFVSAGRAAAAGHDVTDLLAAPELAPLARAWRVGQVAGVPLADVLGRVAGDLATREDQRRQIDTSLAGPRASAVLLAGLPGVGVVLGAAMGARPLGTLIGTPGGRLLCCVGVLLDAAGVLWTARLIRRAER